jgi:D-alanyl-D-alanine carboxypeptidase
MNKQRLYTVSIGLCLSITLLLSGCQKNDDTQVSGSEAQESPTSKAGSSGMISFGAQQYVLAPGASFKIVKTDLSKLKKVSFHSNQPQNVTVNEEGMVKISVNAAIGTQAIITSKYKDESAECAIIVKYALADTVTTNADGKSVVTDPADLAVVVNKQRELPDHYIPTDLVEPQVPFTFKEKVEKRMLRSVAAAALEKLFAQAENDQIQLFAVSGYRSYKTQKSVFGVNVQEKGAVEANKVSAVPGQSEHQTGLAIDLTNANPKDELVESFGSSEEGLWLAAHAADFGFIIRYLDGKEALTGYAYEPWHIRYVGQDIAKEVTAKKITLEQYFDDAIAVQGS